jgi:hypothetical protein
MEDFSRFLLQGPLLEVSGNDHDVKWLYDCILGYFMFCQEKKISKQLGFSIWILLRRLS